MQNSEIESDWQIQRGQNWAPSDKMADKDWNSVSKYEDLITQQSTCKDRQKLKELVTMKCVR